MRRAPINSIQHFHWRSFSHEPNIIVIGGVWISGTRFCGRFLLRVKKNKKRLRLVDSSARNTQDSNFDKDCVWATKIPKFTRQETCQAFQSLSLFTHHQNKGPVDYGRSYSIGHREHRGLWDLPTLMLVKGTHTQRKTKSVKKTPHPRQEGEKESERESDRGDLDFGHRVQLVRESRSFRRRKKEKQRLLCSPPGVLTTTAQ